MIDYTSVLKTTQNCLLDYTYATFNVNGSVSVIFLQKAMVQYTILKTVLLYLLKFVHLYEHQQETQGTILAIFGTFSRKWSEIDLK